MIIIFKMGGASNSTKPMCGLDSIRFSLLLLNTRLIIVQTLTNNNNTLFHFCLNEIARVP